MISPKGSKVIAENVWKIESRQDSPPGQVISISLRHNGRLEPHLGRIQKTAGSRSGGIDPPSRIGEKNDGGYQGLCALEVGLEPGY